VSSANQSTGLEAQVRALRDYCSRNNVNDYILYEDEYQSGVKQSRPALDRMMNDVRDGLVEKVIVYSFSRYARSVTHLLRALEEFKKLNVGFVSITESLDTNTPLGSAVFTRGSRPAGAGSHRGKSSQWTCKRKSERGKDWKP
jgi:DNA invertase Pin-like site-specific DNA recombinase